MFGADDPLPTRPRRVLVAGVTGAGKSTFALSVAERLGVPYTEIDALYHGPNWTPRPEFLDDIAAMVAQDGWVTEWQYRSARDALAAAADTLLWLDYPVRVTMWRLVRRTVRRRLAKTPLWAGNVEPPLWHLFTGKDHVIAWALSSARAYSRSVPALAECSPKLQVVRLRNQKQADRWLAAIR
ncbi:MAG: family ATPase [Glaciihabitans sp.]|nr:family ATPase [Glaciihabitans sp.]